MATPRPRALFACRRDRQRVAWRRAAGMAGAEIAAIERAAPTEIELILAEPATRHLVEAYGRFAALPVEEQLAKLHALAMRLLHLRLVAGDVRAAIFFAREMQAGRDPARSLAEAVVRACRALALRVPAKAPDALDLPLAPHPTPSAADPAAAVPDPGDAAAARAEALIEAERFERRLQETRRRLAAQVRAEAERELTAPHEAAAAAEPGARDMRFAAHARAAARAKADRKRGASPTRLRPPQGHEARALARFAERSCIELRLALMRDARAPHSVPVQAAQRLAGWATPPPPWRGR